MKKTNKIQYTGLAALALLVPAASSMADAYVKQGIGGDLLTNAYQTVISTSAPGPISLSEIDGVFSTPPVTPPANPSIQALPDLFAFDITGLAPFSATTVDTLGTTVFTTQLFLFDSLGRGIYFNNEDPSQAGPGGVQFGGSYSTLPADYLPIGEYYLGIGTDGVAPQSGAMFDSTGKVIPGSGQNIFPYPLTDGSSFTAVDGPTGPGGAAPLNYWNITGDDVETGSYQILLTGAAPLSVVPEGSTFALLGLGGCLLAAAVRRKRTCTQV